MNQNELYHYGIKGQKWGIRRFQEEDGSLTPAGKKRYDDGPVKDKTHNNEDIDQQKKSILNKRNIAIGAAAVGVALAAIGGVYIYKKNQLDLRSGAQELIFGKKIDLKSLSDKDTTLNAGQKLQRISSRSFEDYVKNGSQIYASFDKKDNAVYLRDMPKNIKQWSTKGIVEGDTAYKHTLVTTKEIKIASPLKMAKAYMEASGKTEVDQGYYTKFMTELVDRDKPETKKFFDVITKMGCNAIIDPNDAGHYTRKPIILLDALNTIKSVDVKEVTSIQQFLSVLLS